MGILRPIPALFCILVGTLICLIGGVMFHLMPSIVTTIISKKMTLDPESELTELWTETPIPIYMQFYVFNYTNHEDFLDSLGGAPGQPLVKPSLQQLGPYTYRQLRVREKIEWNNEEDSVTYRQRKVFIFVPEMSSGSEDDLITFPNIPLATIAQMAPNTEKPALKAAIQMTNSTLFVRQPVGRLLFQGYRDELVNLIQILTGEEILPGAMFGLFYKKNDSDDGVYSVHRGNKSPEKLGSIITWNNSSKLSFWAGDQCNAVRGTDASLFRTHVPKTEKLFIFSSELCRSLYLTYKRETEFKGIPGYRFEVSLEMLGDFNMNPDNECYCQPNTSFCMGAGVMNLASCKGGAPVYMSSPHFLMAEFGFLRAVEGLNPIEEEHNTFVELEPLSGSLLRAARRIQMNVHFKPVSDFPIIEDLPEILLPLLWLNESAELSQELVDKIQKDLFTPITISFVAPLVAIGIGGATALAGVVLSLLLNFRIK